jgi:hypothetical protein
MSDRILPIGFVVVAAFASGLVWLMAMMQHVPVR